MLPAYTNKNEEYRKAIENESQALLREKQKTKLQKHQAGVLFVDFLFPTFEYLLLTYRILNLRTKTGNFRKIKSR